MTKFDREIFATTSFLRKIGVFSSEEVVMLGLADIVMLGLAVSRCADITYADITY